MTDNIFARTHSLMRPTQDQLLPIQIQDNPSREFIFPVSAEQLAECLQSLPVKHREGITHIWLRRHPSRVRQANAPLAEFVCGSGIRAIVMYPWRADGKFYVGRDKPQPQSIASFLRFGASLLQEYGKWYVHFAEASLRRFYVEHLFCHEVGHHVDWYNRHWSKANQRKTEEAADQYAVRWGKNAVLLPSDT
jgi:hypothetical protein